VLKTVIAQDATGEQSMRAWATPEARMALQRIRGSCGVEGWTVSWRGRGWSGTLDEYLALLRAARHIGEEAGMLVVPSAKYHLPTPDEPQWKTQEYEYTTRKLLEVYTAGRLSTHPMPIEKDFSPTLAGSKLAGERTQIIQWLHAVPRLIRKVAGGRVRVGLKLFNALFDNEFQLQMLQTVTDAGLDRADFVIYANRLFNPARVFEGHRGIAVGGPDLSDRNLRVLEEFQRRSTASGAGTDPCEICATGNICSGKMAVEYLLRGASTFQLHTFFQLPASEYRMRSGSKTAKALHLLYFDPENGLIAWLLHVAGRLGTAQATPVRLLDLVGAGNLL
jgi:hypothetical protein